MKSPSAGVLAFVTFCVATPVLLMHTAGAALHNGDEAIYAEMAREMSDRGHWLELTWQNEPQFPRPPGAVWILAAARRVVSGERAVRWPLAALAGAQLALLVLLGAALWNRWTGLAAVGVLVTADLFIGYARYFESEPLLCAFVLGSVLCYVRARERPGAIWGWGVLLGCALMTKQLIGGLSLMMPVLDRLRRDAPPLGWPRIARGLVAAAIVWLPWHVYAVVAHGHAFLESYLWANVIERSQAGILRTTRPTFYAGELWRSEGVLALAAVAGVGWALADGVRRRRLPDLLIATWAIVPFAVFSLAASRYDHYLLLIYPALALATAQLLTVRLPARARLPLMLAFVAAGGWLHLARDLSVFDGDDEVRTLARAASATLSPPARLYTYNTHPYSARFYATLDVTTLLESADDLRAAEAQRRTGLPISVEPAADLPATLATRARPFALMMPRARLDLLKGVTLERAGETTHYVLLIAR